MTKQDTNSRQASPANYRAEITGGIWWPMGAKAATVQTFRATSDAEAKQLVLTAHAGDFSHVDGFRLERVSGWRENRKPTAKHLGAWRYVEEHRVVVDWPSEDVEAQFIDIMYPVEDDD